MPRLECGCVHGGLACDEARSLMKRRYEAFKAWRYGDGTLAEYARLVVRVADHLSRARQLWAACDIAQERADALGAVHVVLEGVRGLFRIRSLESLSFGDWPVFATGIGVLDQASREAFQLEHGL